MKKSEPRTGVDRGREEKTLSEDTIRMEIEKEKKEENTKKPIYVTAWTGAVPDGCRLVFLPILPTQKDKEFAEQNKKIRNDLLWMGGIGG